LDYFFFFFFFCKNNVWKKIKISFLKEKTSWKGSS
jgi:hypothetical protein